MASMGCVNGIQYALAMSSSIRIRCMEAATARRGARCLQRARCELMANARRAILRQVLHICEPVWAKVSSAKGFVGVVTGMAKANTDRSINGSFSCAILMLAEGNIRPHR